ncbi:MAG: winged helix-turn-helix transcriptional regulator [Bacteroidetes bacterium]|nr:winged helix-turn-helix transcriptional regulator [Bacteroidota bacterium]
MRRDPFQAIADPTRRAILMLLAVNTMTAGGIADHFAVSRQAVSKHLQIMTECQVVSPVQQGREIHYQLNPDRLAELDQWLSQFRHLLGQRFNQLDDVLIQLKEKPV